MPLKPIYTEPENCQDCYKCIRECPVKAIRIEDNKAYIIEERCIYCGHCTQVCPTGAKKVRDGISRARITLEKFPKVILSLAPSYVSEFRDIPVPRLIAAIRRLGFYGVSETALGAEIVSAKVSRHLQTSGPGTYISSTCPVTVEYIRKYSASRLPSLTPVLSPMLSHARLLKAHYGEDIKIVFAGPCICKKLEADDHPELVEVALTFQDLVRWFEKEHISPAQVQPENEDVFIPYASGIGTRYPIERGMLPGIVTAGKPITKMAFSGLDQIKNLIDTPEDFPRDATLFLELLACKGGCSNGPARHSGLSPATQKYLLQNHRNIHPGDPVKDYGHLDFSATYTANEIKQIQHTGTEIVEALAAIGKTTPRDELNCSGCGYDSCRDFAIAMLEGRAEENMCVSYMRRIAHGKATVILQKIPAGVLLVDAGLKISDMNRYCADLLGEEIRMIYDVSPGLQGMALDKICSFSDSFYSVLHSGQEIKEKQIREQDRIWLLSIYNIQPHQLVFGLLQDLREPYVRKEWIQEKIREVIQKHMATVQQVACLLGENAAFSDMILRSVAETLKDNPEKGITDETKSGRRNIH